MQRIAKKSLWKMVSEMSSIWHENRRSPNVTKNVCKTIAFGWPAKTQIFTFAGKPNETISLTFWPFLTNFFFRKMRLFDWLYTTLVQCRKRNKKLSNIVKEWTKLQNDTRWKLISHKSIKENMVGPSQRKKNFLWGAATKLWSYSAVFLWL